MYRKPRAVREGLVVNYSLQTNHTKMTIPSNLTLPLLGQISIK